MSKAEWDEILRLEARIKRLKDALTTIISAHERYCEAMGARGWKPDNDPLFEACEAARAALEDK